MNTIEGLVQMVLQDAVERGGAPENHHFDESRNTDFLPNPEPYYKREDSYQESFQFNLELVRRPDGSLYWVE